MAATTMKFAGKVCATCLFLAVLVTAQQRTFDGTWQMDAAQSKVSDGRTVTLSIATLESGAIKMTMKTHKSDGQETTSEFTCKLDGKPCEFAEGSHKSKLTVWFNGPTLNASKEGGPPADVTSGWKFELGPNKQMTMTISHYDPAGDDETLVFTKK